ncbi:MAG: hypothetical protein HYR96_11600 [Deltaproteobacteria bacterium]|nr:hypothetical protein [Deltaproteobacteria bacterium]MBI3294947.1 hypothetical protein [Deltaproteobacteria bacterium]
MRNLVLIVVLACAQGMAASGGYSCELKARHNLMEAFEIGRAEWSPERPLEMRLQNFRMRFQTVGASGAEQLAMWLGTQTKEHSAVTLAPLGQQNVYLNFVDEERFAVAECRRMPEALVLCPLLGFQRFVYG